MHRGDSFTGRYVVAMGLIAALSISAYLLLSALIGGQESAGRVINVAGRQRMLSQRAAMLCGLMRTATPSELPELSAALRTTVDRMATAHRQLTEGDAEAGIPAAESPAVRARYFDAPHSVDARTRAYTTALGRVAEHPEQVHDPALDPLLAEARTTLLAELDGVVTELEAEGRARVDRLHTIEGGVLALTLLLLAFEVLTIFRPMTRRIREQLGTLAAQADDLAARERAMRLVLESTGDGLMLVSLDGAVMPPESRTIREWFGEHGEGASAMDVLFGDDENLRITFELGLEQMRDDALPFALLAEQMPQEIVRGERVLRLGYRPVHEAGKLARVLVTVSDCTELAAQAKKEADAREAQAVVMLLLHAGRDAFLDFVEESGALFERLAEPTDELAVWKRDLHTLKGNMACYGVTSVAKLCHDLETKAASGEASEGELQADFGAIRRAWDAALARFEGLVRPASDGRGPSDDVVEVGRDELETLLGDLHDHRNYGDLIETVAQLRLSPVRGSFAALARQAERLAQELGRPIVVRTEGRAVRVPSAPLRAFWASAVHLVRNAVDHGVETPEIRAERSKDPVATLRLSARREGDDLVLRFADDGNGIDWERVRAVAAARGLVATTPEELAAALFADEFSTRDEVSTTSGRGVGLAAVRAEVLALGGTIEVESSLGKGTAFIVRIPLAPLMPRVPELAPRARPDAGLSVFPFARSPAERARGAVEPILATGPLPKRRPKVEPPAIDLSRLPIGHRLRPA